MRVTVEAGSRLHLGFYSILNESRAYGSVGIYLEEPRTLVRIAPEGSAPDELRGLISVICGREAELGAQVLSSPPRHVGAGSTTQIAMSAGLGASIYCGKRLSYREIAVAAERGTVSGIGIHAFRFGGLIVDGGRAWREGMKLTPPKSPRDLPPLISRIPIPNEWIAVLIVPKGGRRVREEEESFMLSPEPPGFDQDQLHKNLVMLLHGALGGSLGLFSRGVEGIQNLMGEYFERYQGGRFSSGQTRASVDVLKAAGALGIGQSSWGPLAYGFSLEERREALLAEIRRGLKREGIDAEVIITKARNRGAAVRIEK